MTPTPLKISIDIDGTLKELPVFLAVMASALQAQGHKVGILTGRPQSDGPKDVLEVRMKGIRPDFFYNRPDDQVDNEEQTSYEWKAHIIVKGGIDVHFDDDASKIAKYLGEHIHNHAVIKTRASFDTEKF